MENLIYESEQPLLVSLHDTELLSRLVSHGAVASVEQCAERPERQRDRSTELVRDIGEEFCLESIHLLEHADAHVPNRRRDQPGDREKRVEIALVERGVDRLRFTKAP